MDILEYHLSEQGMVPSDCSENDERPWNPVRKKQLPQHFNLVSETGNTPIIGSIWVLIIASIMLIPDSDDFFYIIDFVSPFTYVASW